MLPRLSTRTPDNGLSRPYLAARPVQKTLIKLDYWRYYGINGLVNTVNKLNFNSTSTTLSPGNKAGMTAWKI